MDKLLLTVLAVMAPAAGASPIAPQASLSSPAVRDLQCLALAFAAAANEKDDAGKQAVRAEAWYFLGRLEVETPGIDLKQATTHALEEMKGDPQTKEIGSACDDQFRNRASHLANW